MSKKKGEKVSSASESVARGERIRSQPPSPEAEISFSRSERNLTREGVGCPSSGRNGVEAGREETRGYARSHPGLYLPKSASIFNPFANLRFTGVGDRLHPVLFLRKFQEIARFEELDSRTQLHYFEQCLTGTATMWWNTRTICSIEEAITAFKEKYWNTSQQLDLNHRILIGRYLESKDGSMSDYVARLCQENSFLDHSLPEREFVAALTAHFPRDVERELRVSLIRTTSQLMEVLDRIDSAKLRDQQRMKARYNDSPSDRYSYRARNIDRVSKRSDFPPVQGQRVKRWEGGGRASSPPPQPKSFNVKSREDYVKKFPSRFDKRTSPGKRSVVFRNKDPVKETAKSSETVAVMETKVDLENLPSRKEPGDSLSERIPLPALVAPLSASSSLSSSDEQRSVEEYTYLEGTLGTRRANSSSPLVSLSGHSVAIGGTGRHWSNHIYCRRAGTGMV